MLWLFETPAGFALFKVLEEGKLSHVEDLGKEFSSAEKARQVVKLKAFSKFDNTSEALEATTFLIDSKLSKGLRKFLRVHCDGETLAVADSKLGNIIKEKLIIECVHNLAVAELMRGVRQQLSELISGLGVQDLAPMSLGLSHSLSRYRLKFSADKILPEEVETELKEAAIISMGAEAGDDLPQIKKLCDQVLSMAEYRAQLYDYLKSRMNTIAPNLTALVRELVGAHLIAHGGSLLNFAKQPGSTVQILGAEKALFRALKTKHATPKYGIIYHASLIGQAAPKLKGKISRSLAAKAALAIRYDALGNGQDNSMGLESRAKLEAQLRNLEGRELGHFAGSAKGKPKIEVYDKDRKKGAGALITAAKTYNPSADSLLGKSANTASGNDEAAVSKKRKAKEPSQAGEAEEAPVTGEDKKEKKKKKTDEETALPNDGNASVETEGEGVKKDRKKRKHSTEVQNGDENVDAGEKKKKKKKRKHSEQEEEESELPSKKKKKKKKSQD